MMEYVERIDGKVKYAEDNIYRITMFDGMATCYYSEEAVLYEYGEGVSTSGSDVWKERIRRDWLAANEIMFAGAKEGDLFQKKIMGTYAKGNVETD